MRLRTRVAGLVGGVAMICGALAPAGSEAAVSSTGDVLVGSFNISSVAFDTVASGDHATWRVRRPVVVSQILAQRLDVVGIQEASQATSYASRLDFGANQYLDLKNALNASGGNYALTNEFAYNCVKPTTNTNCVYQDRGASLDNRILYDTDTTTLVKQGSLLFSTQTTGKTKRYLVWAVFKMKATGKQFLFTNTHLDPYSAATRQAQWAESITTTNALKGSLPVVAVGDYNTSKFTEYAATYLPRMKQSGYGDVLNQSYNQAYVKTPRAESVVRAWVNSFNGFKRDVRSYAYEDARTKTGNGIDWIFATNTVRVRQWSVVMNLDMQTLQIRGVIPSDHSLVRATIQLP